jgi:putative mycofactocin binding protein MftB
MTTTVIGPGAAQPAEGETVDLSHSWALSPFVALRPEPFGALAYHFGNRRLVFLRRPELVTVVRGLAAAADVRAALTVAGVPEGQWPAYAGALTRLAQADLIRRREDVVHEVGEDGP